MSSSNEEVGYSFAEETLPDLDGGVFDQKLSQAVRDAALRVANHENGNVKGKVTVELQISRIGESRQVTMAHKLASTVPTKRGKKSEEDLTQTPLHVGRGGRLTITPDTQTDMFNATESSDD